MIDSTDAEPSSAAIYRIKRHYSLVAHSPDVVEIRYGVWNPQSFTLDDDSKEGKLFGLLDKLLNWITVPDLARESRVPAAEAESVIDHLMTLGVLQTRADNPLDHYLDHMVPTLHRTDPLAVPTRSQLLLVGDPEFNGPIGDLVKRSVAGLTVADHSTSTAARVLEDTDYSWLMDGGQTAERLAAFAPWKDSLVVSVAKVVHPIRLQVINRACLAHGVPWIHGAFDGPFLFVGPLFVPGRRACYECLEKRVMMNLRGNDSYQQYKRALAQGSIASQPNPIEPVLVNLLSAHIAFEVINFFTTSASFVASKVLSIFLPTMEFSYNEVLRLPGCSGCGVSPEREGQDLHIDLRTFVKHVRLRGDNRDPPL